MTRWLQIVGYSNTGKTRILLALLEGLRSRGETAHVVKLTHHSVRALDGLAPAAKDADLLTSGGSLATIVLARDGFLWQGQRALPDLLAMAAEAADWLLVEGGRDWPTPKVLLTDGRPVTVRGPVTAVVGADTDVPPSFSGPRARISLPDEALSAAEWVFQHREACARDVETVLAEMSREGWTG